MSKLKPQYIFNPSLRLMKQRFFFFKFLIEIVMSAQGNVNHMVVNNQWTELKWHFQIKLFWSLSSFNSSWREPRQRYISHFRTEWSESHCWPNLFRKQEDHKTALLVLLSKSQRKAVFTSNNAEDVLTQWIFLLPPYFLWWEFNYFEGTRGQDRIQRTLTDINTVKPKAFS